MLLKFKLLVERAFNLLTMLLTDQRLTTSHRTLNAILNIKINDKVFTESEKNKIIVAAVKSFMEKRREAVFEENTTVTQTSEEDRMTCEHQDLSEEHDSEDDWVKHVRENVTQKKRGSDADDETVNRWNNKYDDNFGIHNSDDE